MTRTAYLDDNRAIGAKLIGRRIRSALRLLNSEPDEHVRLEWGPVLVEMDDGAFYLIDCEESKSNVILFELPNDGGRFRDMLARRVIRPSVVTNNPNDPLRFTLDEPIARIDVVSRAPTDDQGADWFEMCGLRLGFPGGASVVIGTHLTTSMIPSTSFMLSDEVDPALRYSPLRP
ncbi:MAG: hypothetical protein HOV81_01760 [Kofleriaceae bacterium]|nr:hypothetical protein [Kofleriaceae bacterium]